MFTYDGYSRNYDARTDMQELKGKTPVIIRGMKVGSGMVEVFFSDLTHLAMYHVQDCCESVDLVDVAGDPKDLIGRPLGLVEEVSTPGDVQVPGDSGNVEGYDSSTTTWYKFVSMEGAVTLRWLGTSNGYYSESVDTAITTLENLNNLTDEEKVEWDSVLEKI